MNDGQNVGAEEDFLQWIASGVQLIGNVDLYFGDPAVLCTPTGTNYLKSAYRFVIDMYTRGYCMGGTFTVQDFKVANGLFSMDIGTARGATCFGDLLTDLKALGDCLLVHYTRGGAGGIAALFTDHLHYIITTPPTPLGTVSSPIFERRFILLDRKSVV